MSMRRLPSLNGLRTFEAAARLGSFSDAARELFVTQGAVSRAIAGLESWLGVALFDRTGTRIVLTEAGKLYRDEIASALDRMAVATARVVEVQAVSPLRLNVLPTLAMRWLIPRLPRFQARATRAEVHLATSARPVEAGGTFDVAIRRGPERWPGLQATRFLDEKATPVAAPQLLAQRSIRRPADLAQQTLLHADTRSDAWPTWLARFGAARLKPAGNLRFDHFYLSLQAAQDGLGIAMGPLPLIDDELAAGRLVAPFPDKVVTARSYFALTHRGARSPVVDAFVAWLKEEGAAKLKVP
jgi:LysR family glycine cleavage system transcriptional activator